MIRRCKQPVNRAALTFLVASAFMLVSPILRAQENAKENPKESTQAAQPSNPKPHENESFLGSVGRWFDEQSATINSTLKDARKKIENFGDAAEKAAKTTAEDAKSAADAVARFPNAHVVTGHEKCRVAANGAPDCVAAAETICKGQGFKSGKSLDMTTAESCPPKVYLSGRSSGPECTSETFVSRVLCQ